MACAAPGPAAQRSAPGARPPHLSVGGGAPRGRPQRGPRPAPLPRRAPRRCGPAEAAPRRCRRHRRRSRSTAWRPLPAVRVRAVGVCLAPLRQSVVARRVVLAERPSAASAKVSALCRHFSPRSDSARQPESESMRDATEDRSGPVSECVAHTHTPDRKNDVGQHSAQRASEGEVARRGHVRLGELALSAWTACALDGARLKAGSSANRLLAPIGKSRSRQTRFARTVGRGICQRRARACWSFGPAGAGPHLCYRKRVQPVDVICFKSEALCER